MIGGGIADEERVILAVRVLRRARLPRNRDARQPRGGTGARVHDLPHGLLHRRPVLRRGGEAGFNGPLDPELRHALDGLHDVRPDRAATVGDDRRHERQLQRRGQQLALADAQVEQDATRPVTRLEVATVVLVVGDQPARLPRQVDPGALAQAHGARDGLQMVQPELEPKLVEVDVARKRQGVDQIDRTVAPLVPAGETPAAEDEAPRACDLLVRLGYGEPEVQARKHRDHLERRAGRIGALDGAIEQRVSPVHGEFLPAGERNAARELVGVEARPAHHGENRTVARIHDNGGPVGDVGHRLLEGALGDEIDRERDIVAGLGQTRRPFAQRRDAPAHGVDDHELGAVLAAQHFLVLALDPGLANQVAEPVAGFQPLRQLLLIDLARVPQQLRTERAPRVAPDRRDLNVHARQVRAHLLDGGHDRVGCVAPKHGGLAGAVGLVDAAADGQRVVQYQRRDPPEPVGVDLRPGARDALRRHGTEDDVKARLVVRQQPSVAIANRSARRPQHIQSNAVLLSQALELVMLDDLQPQQPEHHERKAREHDRRERREALFPNPARRSRRHIQRAAGR